ncbi:Root adhesin [Cesiribacter andamanensis AMV16]|uniref:Root adhesin n=2 Tax=Cesiribacter TaxID=1133570 RepID=M7N4J5_9BACT|nr:Root adhesin [Cesiribacter andamanensis AMV16]
MLLMVLCLGSAGVAQGQMATSRADSISQAAEYYELAQEILKSTKVVTQAREYFEIAANLDPGHVEANYMTGLTYQQTINKDRSARYFLRVYQKDPNYRYDLLYSIGRGFQYGQKFEEALNYYNQYKQKTLSDVNYRGKDKIQLRDVERRIEECKNGLEYAKNPKHYAIVNVSAKVNSIWPDYGPVLNEDETILIFTSRRQEDNLNENVDSDNFYFEDIFYSEKVNGEWTAAKNIKEPVNDMYHNSNLSLSADGNTLYVYRYDNGGDIFYSTKEKDGSWSMPQPLSEYINSSFAEKSVSVSKDGSLMFYSSDRPGGLGGLDIYMSRKDAKGKWSRSENLGPIINTEFDDESPFIHYDGKTLYFSSRGRKGMGGYDIYKSVYDSTAKQWTEPINLGYPINTPDEDVFFVATKDGKRGYYASVRDDGQGYTDIYMVNFFPDGEPQPEPVIAQKEPAKEEPKKEEPQPAKPEPTLVAEVKETPTPVPPKKEEPVLQPVTLIIRLTDDETNQPLDATVNLRRQSDNQLAGKSNTAPGEYRFTTTQKQATQMMLSIEKDGYLFKNFKVTLPAATAQPQEIVRTVELNRLKVGVSSVLRNIYFDFDKATFMKESYDELNKLERLLNENPDMVIEISGHTDNVGGKEYNRVLSQRRAQAVVDYVVQKGISKARISAKGYGEERPIASNDDDKEGRALNRRVEFKVLRRGGSVANQ